MTKKINIAIAGHTNTGKTTLIRTLMKTSIGEVDDSPNVTKKGQAYYFDGLQANFIDTPGFQYASVLMMYLDALNENPNFKMPQNWQPKLVYDQDAVEALEKSDVVLYVASLSVVPDDSYKEEINIILRKCQKVVAVLNQYRKQLEASEKSAVKKRIDQWESVFKEQGIERIVLFDAHWDSPVKLNQLYHNILEILDSEQKSYFVEGLKRFEERQREIRQEACSMLASFIEDCREKAVVTISKEDFKNREKQDEAKEKLARIINGGLIEFVYYVCDLYKVAAEYPTTSKDQLLLKMQPKVHLLNRLGFAGGIAAVAGGFGAFIFGILGASLVIFTGGLGAVTAAGLAAAPIGATAGALIGSLAVFSDDGDIVTIKIEPEQMTILLIKGVSIIWGLSNNGYGRGRELSLNESKYIEERVCRIQASCTDTNWHQANKVTIIKYCEKILDLIEKEIE